MEIAVNRDTLNAVLEYLANRPWRETNHLIVALHEARVLEPAPVESIEEVKSHES